MKNLMVFAVMFFSLASVGCDRLSEKDKMEMIAMCDTMARRQIKEKEETEQTTLVYISRSAKIETHYSFKESKCYALETYTLLITGGDNPVENFTVMTSKTLYDGLTKEKLLRVGSANKKGNEWFEGVSGSLKKTEMTREEASKIIKAKMATP